MPELHRCPHCADLRPHTEVNGDLLECGACGLFSRVDIRVNSGATTDPWDATVNAIKRRLAQEPEMATATEVRLRTAYVNDVTFLLRELGEL